ncbi:hypothetical protein TWF173_005214 [Orbilia oligospora]|nr:hypothetical protein TWF173_005214 [Orbilia oligospora]
MTRGSPEEQATGRAQGKARADPVQPRPPPAWTTLDSPNTRDIGAVEPPMQQQPPAKEMGFDPQYPAPAPGLPTSFFTTPPSDQIDADPRPREQLPPIPRDLLFPHPNRPSVDYTGTRLPPLLPENLKRAERLAAAAAVEGRRDTDGKLPTMEIMHNMRVVGPTGSMDARIEDAYRSWGSSLAQDRPRNPPRPDAGSRPGPREPSS